MRAFRFRLAGVLEWRRAQLAAEQSRLEERLAALAAVERQQADLAGERERAENELRGAAAVAAEDFWALAAWRDGARARASTLAARRAQCERDAGAQRERVNAARRACRLLEQLESRQRAEWTYETGRELENFASDAYLARWGAKGRP